MQERPRAVAALLALLLVLVGWLEARHVSEVAHARGLAGQAVHAQELSERHAADLAPHLHGRAVDHAADGGACHLLAILHAPLVRSEPPSALAPSATPVALAAATDGGSHTTAIAAYRLAPKTSPPALPS